MLTSISPLGERARASRWWLTTTAYVVSSVVGGLALGLLAALAGRPCCPRRGARRRRRYVVLAVVLVVGLLLDLGVGGPAAARPGAGRSTRPGSAATAAGSSGSGFGAQLGFGLVTIVTSATTYAVALLCLLSGHPGRRGCWSAAPSGWCGPCRRRSWAGSSPASSCGGCCPVSSVPRRRPTSRLGWRCAAAAAALTVIAVRGT